MNNIDPSLSPQAGLSPEGKEFLQALQAGMGFRFMEPQDCSPRIFNAEFASSAGGSGMASEVTTERIVRAAPELGLALQGRVEPNERTAPAIEVLARQNPIFLHLDEAIVSEDVLRAKELFGASEAGIILHTAFADSRYGGKILAFPALVKGEHEYRVLQTAAGSDPEKREDVLREAMRRLTFDSIVKAQGDDIYAIVDYEEDAVVPRSITRRELIDWQGRVRKSGVHLDLDVGEQDESLDNLLRHAGKLYWCDGNILNAQPISPDQVEAEVESHRNALARFVSDQA